MLAPRSTSTEELSIDMPVHPSAEPSDFILSLPKAELHLHLEGCIAPETLLELSRRNDPASGLAPLDASAVARLYSYRDFPEFLLAFKAVTQRLRTAADYELVVYRMMERLAAENVLHAEVFVSVGIVLWRGEDFAPLFAGMERGRQAGEKDFGVSILWIFDAVRHLDLELAQRVFRLAAQNRHRSVVGIGIGGDERRGPAALFRSLYAEAAQSGLRLSVHAGESVGPESIWSALRELGSERIGHGLSAARDPELMAQLTRTQVPIEICLSSNVRTGCCASLAEHPFPVYLRAGLMLTLSTDDPAMFGTSLAQEYALAQHHYGATDDDLRELARNSFRASFLPDEQKQRYLKMF